MNDTSLRAEYERLLSLRAEEPAPHVPADDMVALVTGTGPEDRRLATLATVMSHPALLRDFELLRAVHDAEPRLSPQSSLPLSAGSAAHTLSDAPAGQPVHAVPEPRSGTRHAPMRWARAAVVVLVASSAVVWLRRDNEPPPFRTAGGDAVTLLEPAADATIAGDLRLLWHRVNGATSYRVEVLTTGGRTVVDRVTSDTVMTVPAAELQAGELRWLVTARSSAGVPVSSPMRAFRLTPE